MIESRSDPATGRKAAVFAAGFAVVATLAAAIAIWLTFATRAGACTAAALLCLATLLFVMVRERRYLALGMASALAVPALMIGAACVSIPLEYGGGPPQPPKPAARQPGVPGGFQRGSNATPVRAIQIINPPAVQRVPTNAAPAQTERVTP